MVLADSDRASPTPPYSGYRYSKNSYAYRTVTFYGLIFQKILLQIIVHVRPYNLLNDCSLGFGLFRVRSPLLTESLNCFLLLRVLRCFSSPGLLPDLRRDNTSSTYWVAPFGHLRITSYLRIPAAFRSLSRPSSPLRAKASSVYSYLLSYLQYLALDFEYC